MRCCRNKSIISSIEERFFFQLVLISWMVTLSSWQKKSSFQMKLVLILTGMYASKIVAFGTQKSCTHILKSRRKRVTVWCGFWSRGIIGSFFFENEQGEAVTVNGDRYRAILAIFGFNRTTLRPTEAKLHSMFCTLFLKIALSAAKLMSFGHLGAAIDTIGLLFVGCRQRQVLRRRTRDNWRFKGQYSWSHWWDTAAHNR